MKRNHILISALILAAVMPLMTPAQHMSDENRIAWTGEMRKYKHQWLTKELEMSTEQSHKFFDLYDEMEDELERIYRETRNLESRTLRNDKSSDTECEAAARAVFEQKKNEAEIELQYFDKFKEILTPQQLLRLRSAERTFVQHVVNAHIRRRASK